MARTLLSERAKAMATAAGWKLRHIQINLPDGTGKLVCQDADGRTLMLNGTVVGTWTMDRCKPAAGITPPQLATIRIPTYIPGDPQFQ